MPFVLAAPCSGPNLAGVRDAIEVNQAKHRIDGHFVQSGYVYVVLELAKHCCVKLSWTSETETRKFKGRQTESMTRVELKEIYDI